MEYKQSSFVSGIAWSFNVLFSLKMKNFEKLHVGELKYLFNFISDL